MSFAENARRIGLLLLLASLPASGEKLPIRVFTAADGLGSAFVTHIMQDTAGYLWFSTRDGLSRFNGYEFTTFSGENGLSSPTILSSFQTSRGEYFILTNGGVFTSGGHPPADGESRSPYFTPFHVREGTRALNLQVITEGPSGTIWAGGTDCVVRDPGGSNAVLHLRPPGDPRGMSTGVTALREDKEGTLWVATNWGVYRIRADSTVMHYRLQEDEASDLVHDLAIDAAGRIWFAHQRLGVIVLMPDANQQAGTGTPHARTSQQLAFSHATGSGVHLPDTPGAAVCFSARNGLTDNNVTALLATQRCLWIGTANGLVRFDGQAFTALTTANGLVNNSIHSLLEDRQGGLWIGSPTGAMCLPPDGYITYATDEAPANLNIGTIGETPGGTIFAVGREWWISFIADRRIVSVRPVVPSGARSMWASQLGYQDRAGRFWALTTKGLCRYGTIRVADTSSSIRPEKTFTRRDGLPSSMIFRLFEDRQGTYWISTRSGEPGDNGIATLGADLATIRNFSNTPGLPHDAAPSAFAEDAAGSLWIGHYAGGLTRFRHGVFRTFTEKENIPSGMITDLLVDRSGRLWIASSQGGIGRIDDPSAEPLRVRRYTRTEGLGSENVRCLVEDSNGRIHAGTVRGVDRLDVGSGTFRHYTMRDGLAGDFITDAFRDSRGILWFGTMQGLSCERPDAGIPASPPPIVITGIRIAGESMPIPDPGERVIVPFVLREDQHDVAIDFSSLSLYGVQDIRYQYRMNAGNGEWSTPLRQRTVNFARLASGAYRFEVRAIGPDGTPGPLPAVVIFTIPPPFWKTWWFMLLVTLFASSVLLFVYRWRMKRLQEITRLRMTIASDLHDELATNLSSIAMFGALVRDGNAEPGIFLDRITTLATESAEVVREIIWSIDPRVETIESVMARLRDTMITSCRARGMQLTMAVSAHTGIKTINLSPEQRKNLWLMLKEAMTNAIKHSGATELSVRVAGEGNALRITVEDNGRGYDSTAGGRGRGLETMRMRARALGGTMSMDSAVGTGTRIFFDLRLDK